MNIARMYMQLYIDLHEVRNIGIIDCTFWFPWNNLSRTFLGDLLGYRLYYGSQYLGVPKWDLILGTTQTLDPM